MGLAYGSTYPSRYFIAPDRLIQNKLNVATKTGAANQGFARKHINIRQIADSAAFPSANVTSIPSARTADFIAAVSCPK